MISSNLARSTGPSVSRARHERRRQVRHPLRGLATVSLRGPSLSAVPTKVVDLSEDGIGVEVGAALQLERTLALDLEFDGERLRLIGQVAWSDSTGRAGVRFFSLDQKALQQIQQWLFLNAVAQATEDGRFAELFPQRVESSLNQIAFNQETQPNAELFRDEEPEEEQSLDALSPLERETNAIVSRALALTGAKGAALALFEGSQLICRATCGTDTPGLGAIISITSGLTGECIRTASVMYCRDTASDPRVDREICADLGIRSLLALPLFAGERVVGLLEVLSQRAGTFDPGDAKVLDMLSRPVIGALFAETPSGTLGKSTAGGIRGRDRESREQNGRFALSPRDVLDLQYLDRQRRRLAQGIRLRGLPLHLRAVLAVAALAVLVPVTWLAVNQGKALLSLRHASAASVPRPSVVAGSNVSVIGSRLPHTEVAASAAEENVETLRQSARKGDVPAQFKLGAKYASGEGVPQDHTKAAYWFQRAAKSGYVPAQGILGAYYWVGRGVPKDLKQAYFWSVLARAGNDEISKQRVDVLAARLTRSDMQEVQQRVREWSREHTASPDSASAPAH